MAEYETPELDKGHKLTVSGEEAKPRFIDFSTRNGKYLKDQLKRMIWQKHGLPMYRGVPVDEVPFELKISGILLDFKKYEITVVYSFVEG